MKDRDWKTLIANIKVGNCILVLGPDIATEKVGDEFKPLKQILSNQLAEEIEKDRKVINPDDLEYTADLYAEINSDSDLRIETESFYREHKSEIINIYKDLSAIPFQLVINATPDRNLIQALEKDNKEYSVDYYNYNGEKRDMVHWVTRNKPMIYYLFGAIDDSKSLVISEKHLFEFLVSIISNEPPIPNNISSEFRDKDKSFLFIGFGFRNWYLRILLYVLLGGGRGHRSEKSSRSFALEQFLPKDSLNLSQVCFLFREDLKVDFSEMKVEDFVAELKKKYEEFAKNSLTIGNEGVIDESAATVFICHASENKEIAMNIAKQLKAGGLNPWIDQEGIRGGDKWDYLLEKTIENSDYFVVLQSKAMAAKKKGYVNKEINLALRYDKFFRTGINYIYPVIIENIDKNEMLEDLNSYQSIDLTKTPIDELIKDIRRDNQRRKNK